MNGWYSNESLPPVLLRGAIAAGLGCALAYAMSASPAVWLFALAVPTITTTRGVLAWRTLRDARQAGERPAG